MGEETAGGGAGPVRGGVVLFVLAAVQFTNIVDFMIVMPLGPRLMRAMAIDPARFGLIVSSYTFAASAAGLLAAPLIDRFDRKVSFLTLYGGFLVGTFACGLAPGYWSLLTARVFTGAFGGVLGGLAMAIIADVFPEEKRGEATGALMSAFAVAAVVGVPLGIVLGNRYGWNAPFLALGGLSVAVLVEGSLALPRLRSHLHAPGKPRPDALAEVRATLTHPDHLWAFALVVSMMAGGFSVIPYISTYLVANVGVRQTELPWVYVVGGVGSLVAAPLFGRLADRHGRLVVYRVIAPLSAVFMLLVTNMPRLPLAVAVAYTAALMVGNSGRMVVAMTMITSCVEPRKRGGFMSLNSSVQHLSSGLGAFVGGAIIGETPAGALTHYPYVGLIAFAATLVSVVLAGRIRPHAGKPGGPAPGLDDEFELGVDPAPAAALEVPPAADYDVPPSAAGHR